MHVSDLGSHLPDQLRPDGASPVTVANGSDGPAQVRFSVKSDDLVAIADDPESSSAPGSPAASRSRPASPTCSASARSSDQRQHRPDPRRTGASHQPRNPAAAPARPGRTGRFPPPAEPSGSTSPTGVTTGAGAAGRVAAGHSLGGATSAGDAGQAVAVVGWRACLRETRCGSPRGDCTRHWPDGC